MTNQTKAYLLTMLVVVFWATSASAFKLALARVTPYTLLFYSILVSTLTLAAILAYRGSLPAIASTPRWHLARTAFLGLLNPFLYYVVLFKAYAILPGQIAMSLNYGWPLVLTLLSVPILRQRLAPSQLVALAISFSGAVLIATRGQITGFGDVSRLGVLLAASSTLVWATFWLFNAKDGQDPACKLFIGFCAGLAATTLGLPLAGGLQLPPMEAVGPLIYIGLFEMSLTFILWLTALQLTESAARIGNLIYIAPFLSLVFLRLVIGETIHSTTFIGLALIIGSILGQETLVRRRARR
jgi:drug/metabolite transporter (DMT)-like permease